MSSYNRNEPVGCIIVLIVMGIQLLFSVVPVMYEFVAMDIAKGRYLSIPLCFGFIELILFYSINQRSKKETEKFKQKKEIEYREKECELNQQYRDNKNQLESEINDRENKLTSEIKKREERLRAEVSVRENNAKQSLELAQQLLDETDLFQKVPSMYADAVNLVLCKIEYNLKFKERPAIKAADVVNEIKKDLHDAIKRNKELEYKYEFLLRQFPQLRYYIDDYPELQEIISSSNIDDYEYDVVRDWISSDDYKKMDVNSRNQLALDNWNKRKNKTNSQIGYEYELYVGHIYRSNGWYVEQFGIDRGLEDLGRDIIASRYDSKSGKTLIHIIQCKYWSQRKEIHENVINQLFGTTMMYKIQQDSSLFNQLEVVPVLYSSTELSETASKFAEVLGVNVIIESMGDYPQIKCNISSKTGEKIYHLPFDQQYFKTKIDAPGELYAWNVNEAVSLGFRRAFKYSGLNRAPLS